MPIIKLENGAGYAYAIWHISESQKELMALSKLTPKEIKEFSTIRHERKKKEYLAGRLTIKAIMASVGAEFKGIDKDEYGKPYLIKSNSHISLSHSFPFAVAIVHLKKTVGIDIERPQPKLKAIAPKFLSKTELAAAADDEKKLCIYWSAKEVLYKIYGRKQMSLCSEIKVDPFSAEGEEGMLQGTIMMPDHIASYNLKYIDFNGYIVCFNE